jgi:hypothetical protein
MPLSQWKHKPALPNPTNSSLFPPIYSVDVQAALSAAHANLQRKQSKCIAEIVSEHQVTLTLNSIDQ